MDWSKGYRATYYMAIVDPLTWRDIETIRITGGSVKREPSGLRESADIDCMGFSGEHWVRIYLDARQDGSDAHEALFTGLATTPTADHKGTYAETAVECYSVLKPCDDILLERGWYAPAGRSGGDAIAELLSVTPAPVEVTENAPMLTNYIIAEDGETNLSMIDRILTAMNWRIRITGAGTIQVVPADGEAVAVFNPLSNDVIEPEINIEADWFSSPNVFMAICDDLMAIAKDESDGPLSISGRGREIWQAETSADLTDGESIGEYARRMLKEAQTIAKTASYQRRYVPDLLPGDVVDMQISSAGLIGMYRVEGQSITLGYNARTSETVSAYLDATEVAEVERRIDLLRLTTNDGICFIDTAGNELIAFQA